MIASTQSIALRHEVEQFYFSEARMLDERRFLAWMKLLAPDVRYVIPARHVVAPEPGNRGTDAFHPIDRELSHGLEPAFREEGFILLAARANRALAISAPAENPPARTRRFIANVEVDSTDHDGRIRALSNFMLSYSRNGADNYLYTGQRQDVLSRVDGGFQIAERCVILDWNVVVAPTLALFF